MNRRYFFGRVEAVRIDFFAFPRCGSHFLRACTAGLFDLVALPHADSANEEAAARTEELDPLAVYALNLREEGVAYHPVWFNGTANGRHGVPIDSGFPILVLIRDPYAAVYSLYRVSRDRWEVAIPDAAAWAGAQFRKYAEFYSAASTVLASARSGGLLMRYEDLCKEPGALEGLVGFVGVRPKLAPAFVHRQTRFGGYVAPGARTFYREGDNRAWERDEPWREMVRGLRVPDFAPYGYASR